MKTRRPASSRIVDGRALRRQGGSNANSRARRRAHVRVREHSGADGRMVRAGKLGGRGARSCTSRRIGCGRRNFLQRAGLPLAPFRAVANRAGLKMALQTIGPPAVLKTAAFGYDGKGQQRIIARSRPRRHLARRAAEVCVLERRGRFRDGAFGPRGARHRWRDGRLPGRENIHANHILDVTVAPAGLAIRIETAARELACAVAESKSNLVGLLAVEMFLRRDGELLINELAPRPHNSGHWTFDACVTSQFEQQLPRGLRPAARRDRRSCAPRPWQICSAISGAAANRTGPPALAIPM